MKLTSPFFADGAILPFECAYEGSNRSPLLSWDDAPLGTGAFALTCLDTDAPFGKPWVHWLCWNIPLWQTRLMPGCPPYERLPDGTEQGLNGFLEYGWGGPCPPSGLHRYDFTLYALDGPLSPQGRTLEALSAALEGHTLAAAGISAYYGPDHALASYEALGREGRLASFSG
ncbi:MAG: YbhB/YbcL family Raf kinase inhibitor-like protein [Spirochaetales bacterium]|nr:YbhB/YbcL family Raf kinase inhibitor-like protein [Spirochaetales bacterium]